MSSLAERKLTILELTQERIVHEAEETDSRVLTDLRRRSKGYWGYSDEWVRRVEGQVIVPRRSESEKKLMFVLQEGKQVLGFYSIIRWNAVTVELDDFFLDPPYIAKGLGKVLWEDVAIRSRTLGHSVLNLIADPNAEGFYLRQGAQRIGEIVSEADPARILPRLQYNLV